MVLNLYQFFLRTADADAFRYLRLFTFEPIADLKSLVVEHEKDPPKRLAQHKLAKEVLKLVHGLGEANNVEWEHKSLFGAKASEPMTPESSALPDPVGYLSAFDTLSTHLFGLLHRTGLFQSGKAATDLIKAGGFYVGTKATPASSAESSSPPASSDDTGFTFVRCNDHRMFLSEEQHFINGNRLVFRLGKTKVRVIGIERVRKKEV